MLEVATLGAEGPSEVPTFIVLLRHFVSPEGVNSLKEVSNCPSPLSCVVFCLLSKMFEGEPGFCNDTLHFSVRKGS